MTSALLRRAERRVPALPWVAAAAVMLMWASSFIVIRDAGPAYPPAAMTLLRCLAASAVLALLLLAGRVTPPRTPRLWAAVAGWGVLWFGVYTYALNAAETRIDAATAAMVVNIAPLLVAALSGVVLGERPHRRVYVGVAVAFLGICLITAATAASALTLDGLLLALLAALMYAAAVLVQKRLLAHVDSTSMTVIGVLAATLATLPTAVTALPAHLAEAPAAATLGVVYLGVFPTAAAFLLWGYALSRLPAGVLTSSSLAVPSLALLMSWLLLDEVPVPLAVLGGAVCLAGVAFSAVPEIMDARRRRAAR